MKVYVVVLEDRHADVDVRVFAKDVDAVEYATSTAISYGDGVTDTMNDSMERAGWLYHASREDSFSIRVEPKEVK